MDFGLLGPLEARDDDRLLALGGPKQRTLLAHLLLRANRVVTAEQLIEALWGDEPPDAARNTLQTYVKHLRKLLGPERIRHRSGGYVLEADPAEIDVLRFEALVDEGRRTVAVDAPRAVAILREALGLWRGPALGDLADQPSLRPEIARLEETRLTAIEEMIDAELGLGRHRELVAELESLTHRHAFRERLWGHLMLALYRSGRQADALAAYRRARDVLHEELGIDPSPELHRLQEQVLRQDPALDIGTTPLRGYRLLERIGEGTSGTVHRAFQPEVGREVAIKVISPRLANDVDYIRRFDAEAQLVARLEHPHVVPLYDYWREPDAAYLVMRYLRGGSLRDVLEAGPLAPSRAVRMIGQLADALSTAHRQGVMHGDVKPTNVLFDEDGNAYLSDFGIARAEAPTVRTDVHGLGVVLRESLGPDLPERLRAVIERATHPDRDARHADAIAFAAAVREALAAPEESTVPAAEIRNPYKGLRAFAEADAADFFGREGTVQELLHRMGDDRRDARFLAVVGPSGSGKSSLVGAGLVPALRDGALPGSERWFVVELTPGSQPFEALDAAIVRVAVDPPPDLLEPLARDENGLLRVADEVLPDDGSDLLLVIDQFEELFTLVEREDTRARFLGALRTAAADPRSRIRIVVTLRADFYDRPLQYGGFGELLAERTYAVTPLSATGLERAIVGPADAVGVSVGTSVVGALVAEVADRPGALPLLQYALTELFEARDDGALTLEAYRRLGGASGALARRAEELYAGLDHAGKESARQLFLRLVGLGSDGVEDTRRRVPRAELVSLDVDRHAMDAAIDTFGAHRLLSFDRDPETRGPTVEVAHETLLREWSRLRGWIESAREDIRLHARLSAAAGEWLETGRSPDYLLTGERLAQTVSGAGASSIRLTDREREYLDASVGRAEAEAAQETERRAREIRLEHRAFSRMRALVAVLAVASIVAASLTVIAIDRTRDAERQRDEAAVAGLTGAALSNLGTDPELSLLFALRAVDRSSALGDRVPAETVEALHWAFQRSGIAYPAAEGPTAVVDGPLGRRGILDLPLDDLVAAARAHIGSLTPQECARFEPFEVSCGSVRSMAARDLDAEPVRALVPAFPAQPLAGTEVEVVGIEDPGAMQELERIGEATGIEIRWVSSADVPSIFERSPDIAWVPQPGRIAALARDDLLVDLGTYLDVQTLRGDFSPYLLSLAAVAPDGTWPSRDGVVYGVPISVVLKELVWYPVPEFHEAGYTVPETWDELVALTERMVADGRTPWCMGLESGEADGWPATDWIENLVLGRAGTDVYDRWASHEIPFDAPVVREAFERFGQIVFDDRNLFQGAVGAVVTPWETAQVPMVDRDPPGCWLYHFASFAGIGLPPRAVGTITDAFPFPAPDPGNRDVMLGGANWAVAFSDRPEVREVIRALASHGFGQEWFTSGEGHFSANRRFDRSLYDPPWRRLAELLDLAFGDDTFRMDGGDLMPTQVGTDAFWSAMKRLVVEGPASLDPILAGLEAAWPDDG